MSGESYQPLIFKDLGGNRQTFKSGAELRVEAGSKFSMPVTNLSASATLTAATSGTHYIITANGVTVTLPSTAAGVEYSFSLAPAAITTTAATLSISPSSIDSIIGNGFTVADNKDLKANGTTEVAGDFASIKGDGSAGWYITGVVGTWVREG